MAVKLDNSSNRWIRSQSSTVDKELEKKQRIISDLLDYDISISFIFNIIPDRSLPLL